MKSILILRMICTRLYERLYDPITFFCFQYLASSQKTVTDFVERTLKTVAPAEYTSRAVSHQLELVQGLGLLGNEQIAIFICTTAFPCVACPLFVYEPRYRLMVRRCMDSGVRQFGIAACLNKEATGTKRCSDFILQ